MALKMWIPHTEWCWGYPSSFCFSQNCICAAFVQGLHAIAIYASDVPESGYLLIKTIKYNQRLTFPSGSSAQPTRIRNKCKICIFFSSSSFAFVIYARHLFLYIVIHRLRKPYRIINGCEANWAHIDERYTQYTHIYIYIPCTL